MNTIHPPISVLRAGLGCRCPRCGQGRLFAGYLALVPACAVCGLDLTPADSADGPAFFVMWGVAAVIVLCAVVTEILFAPPVWLHMVLWIAMALAGSALLLRPVKGLMVALQYRHRVGGFEHEPPA